MRIVRFNTALFVLCAMLGLSGCHEKKKPSAQLPPAPAPTPSTASQQPPIQQPTPQTTQEPPSVQQPAQQQTAQNETSKPKPQPRHPRHTVTATPKKPAPADEKPPEKSAQEKEKQTQEVAHNVPPKIVIQEGGTNTPGSTQPASTNTPDNTAHNEPTTGQLLDSTENNLRNLKRQLSADEQTTQAQIKDYVSQARQAIKDGDMVRAHNLAVKAHLLCDELVKQH